MGMSAGGGGGGSVKAEPNVTPLVDVMLVLLIIFMVTAPLLTAGVPVDLPDARAKALDADDEPVTVSLDRTGKLFVDETELAEADLPARLERIAAYSTSSSSSPRLLAGLNGDIFATWRISSEYPRPIPATFRWSRKNA